MLDLFDELIHLVRTLDSNGIPYALVGGVGFSLLVHPRATEDLDFLIHPGDWPKTVSTLESLGWQDVAGPMNFKTIEIRRLTKIADTDVLVADFLLANENTAPALDRAESLPFKNQPIKVAPPETIITLKEGRNSPKDQEDIRLLRELMERRK